MVLKPYFLIKIFSAKFVLLFFFCLIVLIEYKKVVANKQIMTDKKTENEMVLTEFKLLTDDAKVYKLVGPILAQQDIEESRNNVEKRVEFIEREVARLTTLESEFQNKLNEKTASVKKIQGEMQQMVMQMQQKAQQAGQPQGQ